MDITRSLVCMGINIENMLTYFNDIYYCVNYIYDCSVLFSGSLSYYIVSDLKNVYYINNPYIYVTYFKFIYNNIYVFFKCL